MPESYWREHHRLALSAARASLFETRKRTVIAVAVWITALVLVWTTGDHADVKSEIILSIAFTVALGLVFPGAYAWEFISLVPRRAKDAEDSSARLIEISNTNAKTRRANGSDFVLHIQCCMSRVTGNDVALRNMLIVLRLINRGNMPSVAIDWNILLLDGSQTYQAQIVIIGDITAPLGPDGQLILIPAEDQIVKKSATPIAGGAIIEGHLYCRFPGLEINRNLERATLFVACYDAQGNSYNVSHDLQDVGGGALPYMPLMSMVLVETSSTENPSPQSPPGTAPERQR